MSDFIEGRRAVEEAMRAGLPIVRAYVAEAASGATATYESSHPAGPDGSRKGRPRRGRQDSDPALNRLVDRLRKSGVEVRPVPREELDRMSVGGGSHGAHQGVVAEVPSFRYASPESIARAGGSRKASLVLVLDHITDEGNLGAIIRTAEVVGADGVIIPSKRAAQVTSAVYKTSAGAALHIPIARVPNLVSAIELLKKGGYWVAGASEKAPTDIWHAPLAGRIALVAGSEGDGMSRVVRDACDFLVSLPQRGKVASLNVAQATTAIAYEWLRRCAEEGLEGRSGS